MNILILLLLLQVSSIDCVDFYNIPDECRPYSLEGSRWMVTYCHANRNTTISSRDLCDLYREVDGYTSYTTVCYDRVLLLERRFVQDCQLYNTSSVIYQRCYPFNALVTRAERWERPLLSRATNSRRNKRFLPDWQLSHSGMVVTTEDGHRWLIEKGFRTTVNDVSEPGSMDPDWRLTDCGTPANPTTLGIFWVYGLPYRKYHLLGPNCHTATRYMLLLVNQESC